MEQGFTLIELLITITVVTIGIAGAFIAIQQGISAIDYSNARFTAAFLAQEGVEIIKNIRDTNFLERTAWNEGLDVDGDYEVQYRSPQIMPCPLPCTYDNGLDFLTKDDNGFYNYNPAESQTKFKRRVNITSSPDKLEIEVTVYWRKRGGTPGELILRQDIYNWW